VIEAVDGLEGFELWKSSTPDLIFVDVLMPGLSGPELLEKFSAEIRPRLGDKWKGRVILMSAYSGEHNIATAQQMGANLFVPKPFDDIFALVAKAEALFNESSG
jgi:CheY-like chemotaxis protein